MFAIVCITNHVGMLSQNARICRSTFWVRGLRVDSFAQLTADLRDRTSELVASTIQSACSGSFWDERFGERGRRHIEGDSRSHITQLTTALQLGTPTVMEEYARWLQSVLTVRGMCTLHIDEHFESLASAIRQAVPNSRPAVEYINAARAALKYTAISPRAVQERSTVVIHGALDVIYNHNRILFRTEGDLDRTRVERDIAYLLSYLIDAMALQRDDIFQKHVAWIAEYHLRRGYTEQYLPGLLAALALAAAPFPMGVRNDIRTLIKTTHV